MDLRSFIRDVPDFPKPGIIFKDITPLLKSREAFERTIESLAEPIRGNRVTADARIYLRSARENSAIVAGYLLPKC